ncbi:MAG TPA: hypothetical protein VI075_05690, partial [Methyloceanibacter sp.]
MSVDARGWRIALIADALLNAGPRASLPDVIAILEASSYGVLQLPPASGAHDLLLAVTADQVAEYSHHGYAVVAIGLKGKVECGLHWRRLKSLLRQRNSSLPPRHVIAPKTDAAEEARRLAAFL